MTSIKEWAVILTKALEEKDMATFKRCRTAIVSALADNDYMWKNRGGVTPEAEAA